MKFCAQKLGTGVMTVALVCGITSSLWAKPASFVGVVSDSMCGAKHAMAGDAASCTRACVSKGSKYALVVGDKVYTLETSNKSVLTTLDARAGAKVKVWGTAKGDSIAVESVSAAP
ncbi:MAG TPA: hypothetical protein VKV39_05960 [Candidatus Sulfotelmatobacter sp.]|nr:hypothetical protein [Candidatus Sulfotelmatobacter sp.]